MTPALTVELQVSKNKKTQTNSLNLILSRIFHAANVLKAGGFHVPFLTSLKRKEGDLRSGTK